MHSPTLNLRRAECAQVARTIFWKQGYYNDDKHVFHDLAPLQPDHISEHQDRNLQSRLRRTESGTRGGGLRVKTKLLLSFCDRHCATREQNHSAQTDFYSGGPGSNFAGQSILTYFVILLRKCRYHDRLLPDPYIPTFHDHLSISLQTV